MKGVGAVSNDIPVTNSNSVTLLNSGYPFVSEDPFNEILDQFKICIIERFRFKIMGDMKNVSGIFSGGLKFVQYGGVDTN